MMPFASSRSANSLSPLGGAVVVGWPRGSGRAPTRWRASAERHKAERERSQPAAGWMARKSLNCNGIGVASGSGRVVGTPPPLRFAQPEAEAPQHLPPRKMEDPQGGAGGRRVA